MTARPSPGDLLIVDGRASVQFAGDRALTFRVVAVSDQPTYPGWIWLTGYVLNRRGEATTKREIYVQLAGLHPAPSTPDPRLPRVTHPYASRNDQGDGGAARKGAGCVLGLMLGDAIGATAGNIPVSGTLRATSGGHLGGGVAAADDGHHRQTRRHEHRGARSHADSAGRPVPVLQPGGGRRAHALG
ncbi:hypothetical protein [Micromonospora echinaurantiaca]|uniref:hypothetical protein n=1 Tax=Micromonospora echinaurantiaca TaxID=47857 RepID=UPI0037A795AD